MRRLSNVIAAVLLALVLQSCEFKLQPFDAISNEPQKIEVRRYDRLESQYLTTSDFSALQQMSTEYPMETRTLIENMLKLGEVNDPQINKKFLTFYQDSTLQALISDAESRYANIGDINEQFNKAFDNLKEIFPDIHVPMIYMQIGALDQSIVVGNGTIGISLDKYLGENYPLYKKYYPLSQRKGMNRGNIVPDAMCFYLMSLYPLHNFEKQSQAVRDLHVGKLMWLTNRILERREFRTKYVDAIDGYLKKNPDADIATFIINDDCAELTGILTGTK